MKHIRLTTSLPKNALVKAVALIKSRASMPTQSAIRSIDYWSIDYFSLANTDPYIQAAVAFEVYDSFPEYFDTKEVKEDDPWEEYRNKQQEMDDLLTQAINENDGEKALKFCKFFKENPGFYAAMG